MSRRCANHTDGHPGPAAGPALGSVLALREMSQWHDCKEPSAARPRDQGSASGSASQV